MMVKKGFHLFVLAFLVLFCQLEAVDKSKFRTCEQTGFCRRNRKLEEGSSQHFLDSSTIQTSSSQLSADLVHPSYTSNPLTLTVSCYENGIFRTVIDEKSSTIKKRWQVQDVLLDKVTPLSLSVKSQTSEQVLLSCSSSQTNELRIQFKPLKIEALQNGVPIIIANDKSLFQFEHYRLKSQETQGQAPEDNQEEDKEEEEAEKRALEILQGADGSWEESFGSHQDSKPFGPSSVGLDFTFVQSLHLYGIPEHASHLALKATKGEGIQSDPYRLYNLDVFEYELDQTAALYGAIPLLLSHSEHNSAGIFWLNPTETWIDISSTTSSNQGMNSHWFSEAGVVDIFFLFGPTPQNLFSQYGFLTGTTELPPLFSIGYHQCRWNYKSEEDVSQVDASFDEYDIPYDVIWLDIEHTDGKRYFTWDKNHFPHPETMQANIAEKGRKMVTIVDPHVKRDSNYFLHSEAQSKGNVYIKNAQETEYDGWCWPGSSSWPDYVDPQVREWWAEKFAYSAYKGSSNILFTWNDMNEPSVFNGPEVTMHKDAKHFGNLEHREVHNVYGYYMHMATSQGLISRNEGGNERPFVLSRAFFSGTQRYGPIWTGDNAAQWGHLEYSVPMLLSLGISGLTFSGADVGGFFGNPSPQMLIRWYQVGAFQPFFRGHAHLDTKRREPWVFGEPFTSHIRDAIRTRYQLLPFWYTLYYQTYLTGAPTMRPLWVEFPKDPATFAVQDAFLVGSALLVKPIVHDETFSTQVYLPGTQPWYEYNNGNGSNNNNVYQGSQTITVSAPLDKIPVFQRGGTIVPKKDRVRRSSSLMHEDPFTLQIALDNNHQATGELYVDDGHSFNFKKGSFLYRQFSFKDNVLENTQIGQTTQTFQPKGCLIERIVIQGYSTKPSKVTVESASQPLDVSFHFDSKSQILTLRKPNLPLSSHWKLVIQN